MDLTFFSPTCFSLFVVNVVWMPRELVLQAFRFMLVRWKKESAKNNTVCKNTERCCLTHKRILSFNISRRTQRLRESSHFRRTRLTVSNLLSLPFCSDQCLAYKHGSNFHTLPNVVLFNQRLLGNANSQLYPCWNFIRASIR